MPNCLDEQSQKGESKGPQIPYSNKNYNQCEFVPDYFVLTHIVLDIKPEFIIQSKKIKFLLSKSK